MDPNLGVISWEYLRYYRLLTKSVAWEVRQRWEELRNMGSRLHVCSTSLGCQPSVSAPRVVSYLHSMCHLLSSCLTHYETPLCAGATEISVSFWKQKLWMTRKSELQAVLPPIQPVWCPRSPWVTVPPTSPAAGHWRLRSRPGLVKEGCFPWLINRCSRETGGRWPTPALRVSGDAIPSNPITAKELE